ncbi:ABC transporter ATP-binding protein [Candidatus Woesearchaeota archaeon]|nr:ABC transporter ATP-binding protein [Candidatus Woesearchaeota archaeon]
MGTPEKYMIRYSTLDFLKDYWHYLNGYRAAFIFYILLRYISGTGPFLIAYLLGKVIDFITSPSKVYTELHILVLLIALTGLLQVLLRFHAKIHLYDISASIRKKARLDAVNSLLGMGLDWHGKENSGKRLERINSGADKIQQFMNLLANDGIEILVGITLSMMIFPPISPSYAAFAVLFGMFYIVVMLLFNRKIEYWNHRLSEAKEDVTGRLQEASANILTVKSLGSETSFHRYSEKSEQRLHRTYLDAKKVSQLKSKIIKSSAAVIYALFILLLARHAILGIITVGSVLTYAVYFEKLRSSLDKASDKWPEFLEIKNRFSRMVSITQMKTQQAEWEKFPDDWQSIIIDHVSCRIGRKNILTDITYEIKRGEKIGIAGRCGAGKSSLVKILLGLSKPNSGKIIISGKDISSIRPNDLLGRISAVPQECELFDMSFSENITMGKRFNSRLFRECIMISHLDDVIRKLPEGIKTGIGEKGYRLSGGEKQRINIARALYREPQVLIMDESTSNLDMGTESVILDNISKLDITLIFIAHRLKSLRWLDEILVLDKGLKETGSYPALLRKKGHFYSLLKN